MPPRIVDRVLFPAPFSRASECTRPACRLRSTSLRTSMGPKRFVIPRSSITGVTKLGLALFRSRAQATSLGSPDGAGFTSILVLVRSYPSLRNTDNRETDYHSAIRVPQLLV